MPTREQIFEWLGEVTDPEVPVLTILDLGIVRDVQLSPGGGEVKVSITPTYSGCPAMDAIGMNIRLALSGHGIKKVNVDLQLQPAWTTDWMTEEGKTKLKEYGIAPPGRLTKNRPLALFEEEEVPCPRCDSINTKLVSNFGATSCKAAYVCNSCHEPFEHFKCH